MEVPAQKIYAERLSTNLNRLVEKTKDFGVEKLSSLWFELFDLIESSRSLPSEELIFEVCRFVSSRRQQAEKQRFSF